MIYHSGIFDTGPLSSEPQSHEPLWWGLAFVETLLLARLLLGFIGAQSGGIIASFIYQITDYFLYPFAALINASGLSISAAWVIIVATTGYLLLTLALVSLLDARESPRSRFEHIRTLSRRRYNG